MKAAYVDLKSGHKDQGASTLSMQLARGFWLDPEKTWKRKLEELLITMHLEQKLTKQKIFEYYANEVYLGRHATFSINGFGEAAQAYFGKDLGATDRRRCRHLAGLVQRPSYFNPYRYPERARERRNVVLAADAAERLPDGRRVSARRRLRRSSALLQSAPESSRRHYFVDLMNDELQNDFDDHDKHVSLSIYTTLDPDLQHAAAKRSVDAGMKSVDKQLREAEARRTSRCRTAAGCPGRSRSAHRRDQGADRRARLRPQPVEPCPGDAPARLGIQALCVCRGARYGGRRRARRFSPRPASWRRTHHLPVSDIKRTNREIFMRESMGDVTLRTALAHSLNVVAVRLAREVGYPKVVAMAKTRRSERRHPADAGGGPGGLRSHADRNRRRLHHVRQSGDIRRSNDDCPGAWSGRDAALPASSPERRPALDPRVNYLMVNMMEEVLRSRNRRGSAVLWLYAAGRGQNRNVARWLVCGLYQRAVLRRLGRLRR